MARRKMKEKNIRKITRMGNRSLGITLPVEFLNELGWKEKQKIIVKRTYGGMIISDWRKRKRNRQ